MPSARGNWAAGNWFVLALPFLFVASCLFVRTAAPSDPGVEAVTLFDWVVTVPILYFLCYRRSLAPRQMALRLLGLICLGIYVASHLVPMGVQEILPHLAWPRAAGIAVLLLIELRLVALAIQFAFSGRGSAEELAATSGAPLFVARLMLLEARFWRAVWRLISRR